MEIAPVRVVGAGWAKGPARIEDGEIVLDEERAETYEFKKPEDSERMAFDLAALFWRQRDETAVVTFVRRYGLLLHGAEDIGGGECRESLADWWRESARLYFVGALYHALMASKDALQDQRLATQVQDFLRQFGYGFPYLTPGSENFEEEYLVEAGLLLQTFINEGLYGGANEDPGARKGKRRCWWGLAAVGPGEFRLTQYPPDLLSRSYSALAALIAGNVETRFCAVCGKQFRPKSRRGVCCSAAHQSTYRARKSRAGS